MLCSLLNNEEKLQAFSNICNERRPRGDVFTIKTKAKASPLWQDVPEENFLIVRKMVEFFPELLDVRDCFGKTSLHWAMTSSKTSTAYGDLLLELGADPFIPCYYNPGKGNLRSYFVTFFSGGSGPQVVPAIPHTNPKSPLQDKEHFEGLLAPLTGAGKRDIVETGRKQVFMHVLRKEAEKISHTTWANMYNHVLDNKHYRKINGLEDKPTNKRGRKAMKLG